MSTPASGRPAAKPDNIARKAVVAFTLIADLSRGIRNVAAEAEEIAE
ncbi:hypothetical protein [Arthrobacter sp. ISL-65]|nr:hypothetical protein [Arthrobacter sp. ISL-65]MBT2550431.1 hypothetical protein [Arthrobacter sp. ISL-65]